MSTSCRHDQRDALELARLALELADEAARADIECECPQVMPDHDIWYDLAADPVWQQGRERGRALIARADRYLRLRGEDVAGYRVVRHPAFPHLIRFEARP